MATGDNAVIPLFEPGERITANATAVVAAGRFVKISGDMESPPIMTVATPITGGNNVQCAQCVAGDRAFGVAGYDAAAIGDKFPVINGPGIVVPMTAGGTITANDQVMSDAAGKPVTWTSAASEANHANGLAVSSAASAGIVYIRLYT